MEPRALRRVFLWSFLGCLGLTALLAIGAVLSGTFGEMQARVLASSAAVSGASVCAMACAAFRERGRVPGLGTVGIALVAVALLLTLGVVWNRDPGNWQVRVTMVVVVWAVATAHAQLLLLPRLASRHAGVQPSAVAAIALLAVLLSTLILGDTDGDGMLRFVGVVAIVVALLTLAVPILWKIGGEAATVGEQPVDAPLVLRRGIDGVWVDADGTRYEVRRVADHS